MTKRSADPLEQVFKRISIHDSVVQVLSYDTFQKQWLVELQSGKKEYRAFKDLSHESIFETYIYQQFKKPILRKKSTPSPSPSYIT